ncbi:replication-relaxation family protein [Streptomyces sp. DSM 44917]|uniref:Replication-relaxation family protein n=1 Tax=Streptomyces boetiae TaxID=3075541 RepID=A0ABU2L7N2_9ACTN|nr:replication-relaxation family protein [Streptomyces sp. DSM 44917]MDT0307223.1 replication-relaxation family protein [Streptomyces sp. DSM 44917]
MTDEYPFRRPSRSHQPARAASRIAVSGPHLAQLAGRLTARDRWLARILYEHKVLTAHQIARIGWPSVRAANKRLIQLYRWRVADRFQPFTATGSAPLHYVLDIAGAAILAAEDGLNPRALPWRHHTALGIAHSLHLPHTTGINGLFTTLIARARRPGSPERLTAWWSETRCARHFGDIVRPDAYGRWHDQRTGTTEWFLEYDRGTETLEKLANKLRHYHQLARATGVTTPVLIWLPSAQREAGARTALAAVHRALDEPDLVPVATTSTAAVVPGNDPAAARWLPLAARGGRLPLAHLTRAWPHLPPVSPTSAPDPGPDGSETDLRPASPMPPG